MKESISKLPVVETEELWWLDPLYHGGVSKRIGWWVTEGKYRTHWYVVVFHDGTRSEAKRGWNAQEEV